jgi:glycosyltransferase involved in cell wall biosynthesis
VNAGQFGATQAGLRTARGSLVVVLDGDLQDPPELVPRLVAALAAADASVLAVFAVKASRDDPTAFMLGQFVFHALQRGLSRVALPPGAGSYCLMRDGVAQRVASAALKRANVSAVVAVAAGAMGGTLGSVPYDKAARYDETTRVGWRGLILEALESLELTGALSRFLGLVACALAAAGIAALTYPIIARVLWAAGAVAAVASLWVASRARRALASVRAVREP